jgi:hypothetical protein
MTLSRRSNGAARHQNAGRVGFVDHEDRVLAAGHGQQVGEVGAVAVHAVEALDRDPGPSVAARVAPLTEPRVECIGVLVRHALALSKRWARQLAIRPNDLSSI